MRMATDDVCLIKLARVEADKLFTSQKVSFKMFTKDLMPSSFMMTRRYLETLVKVFKIFKAAT